jgi:actin-related protein
MLMLIFRQVGFSGEECPRVVFPSLVGRNRFPITTPNIFGMKEIYVGDDAQSKRGVLSLSCPIQDGIIVNWEDMELIWQHSFENELSVSPGEHTVVLTESPLNPHVNREKAAEIMFEHFHFSGFYSNLAAVFSLYSLGGRTTGCVIDSGHEQTQIVPVVEGKAVSSAITRLESIGGRYFTEYIRLKTLATWPSFRNSTEIARDIKEHYTYVALDYERTKTEFNPSNDSGRYELPEGNYIEVKEEGFQCPEAFFQPSIIGKEGSGLHECVFQSVMKCNELVPSEVSRELYANIVLSGGNTMFPGLPERLTKELNDFHSAAANDVEVNVVVSPDRKYLSWIGAAMMAESSNFNELCISKAEYEEFGSSIIQRKLC